MEMYRTIESGNGRRSWLGSGYGDDSRARDWNLVNRRLRTHLGVDRSDFSSLFSVVGEEKGNATLGFAMTAPLLAIFTAALLTLAGSLWQRELAFSLLEKTVTQVARGQSTQTAANVWRAQCLAAGLTTTAIRWSVSASGERRLIRASSTVLLPSPIGDGWQVDLQVPAVVE